MKCEVELMTGASSVGTTLRNVSYLLTKFALPIVKEAERERAYLPTLEELKEKAHRASNNNSYTKKFTDRQVEIVKMMLPLLPMAVRDMAAELGVTEGTLRDVVSKCVESGNFAYKKEVLLKGNRGYVVKAVHLRDSKLDTKSYGIIDLRKELGSDEAKKKDSVRETLN